MKQRLSVGDAIGIVALLIFAVGWVAFWTTGLDDSNSEVDDDTVAVILLVLIFGPPTYALWLVKQIVRPDE